MIKIYLLPRLLVFALFVTGCSIEIDQATALPSRSPTESISATSPTAVFPTAQIPVAWADLHLTGKLIYLSSTKENDIVTGTVQMLDLLTGDIATIQARGPFLTVGCAQRNEYVVATDDVGPTGESIDIERRCARNPDR